MKNKIIIILSIIIIMITSIFLYDKLTYNKINLKTISIDNENITLIDDDNIIYTFTSDIFNVSIEDNLKIKYKGIIDKNKTNQNIEIVKYEIIEDETKEKSYEDKLFASYYDEASITLEKLSLEEKIGQLILARYNEDSAIEDIQNYHLSGFVLFEKDFKYKTKSEVIEMITNLQKNSKIPLLIAVDEEGGQVVRVSSNPNLSDERFKSPQELYSLGGIDEIRKDTIEKSNLLSSLGINLNLAPVVDITTNSSDYMYERSIAKSKEITSMYAKTVINASHSTNVSYTLKHFPGYGNNIDTHTGSSIDTRSYEDILNNDLMPFKEGIDEKAESVMISHNIVTSIDPNNPASLSKNIHNLLRNHLNFSGIIITDDISMGATKDIEEANLKATLSGNNLIITSDYEKTFNEILESVNSNKISEELINRLALDVIAWKHYKGLM